MWNTVTILMILDLFFNVLCWFRININISNVIILLNIRVKPVLNFILRAADQFLANFRPAASNFRIVLEDEFILLVSPLLSFDSWIEFVDKSFSDLLARLGAHYLSQEFPIFAHFLNERQNCLILFSWPNLFMGTQLWEPPVSVETLIFISVLHETCNNAPFLGVLLVKFDQLIIFFWAPSLYFSFFRVSALGFDF